MRHCAARPAVLIPEYVVRLREVNAYAALRAGTNRILRAARGLTQLKWATVGFRFYDSGLASGFPDQARTR